MEGCEPIRACRLMAVLGSLLNENNQCSDAVPLSSLNRNTLLRVHRGVLGVLDVLQSTLWPEILTPNLEFLLARTASTPSRGGSSGSHLYRHCPKVQLQRARV